MSITFEQAIEAVARQMHRAPSVRRGKWQGLDVSKRPEMVAYEICHYSMRVPLHTMNLEVYRHQIKPNLPWADDHFLERVCGQPLNPGVEWANWPWGKNADKFRDVTGIFDHNYMERYWPKFAGRMIKTTPDVGTPNVGIRYEYGDLDDVVEELLHDPTTRQAILPVFFPEDTGYRPGRRKPCSLHYHFMLNGDGLDIQYTLRSCDFVRHFRDDIYLTVRLLLWMLEHLRRKDKTYWDKIKPGLFVMHIANLHMFVNDRVQVL